MRNKLVGLLLFAGWGIGCGSADSVLRVNLDPSPVNSVTTLATQTTVGGEHRPEDIGSQDGPPIDLSNGTSYTIQIPHQYSGAAQIVVTGLDANNTVLLNGTGSLDELNVGQLNDVEVAWLPGP
jgi:hypothetical protein